jgi:hypothetical protein
MSEPLNVTVTLIHSPRRAWFGGRRWQAWRWVAHAANGRILATSGESYTNRADALAAVELLFGEIAVVEKS